MLVYFASSGRTDYFERFVEEKFGGPQVVVQFNRSQGPQLIDKVDLMARDRSYGLFSLEKYRRCLARAVARRVRFRIDQVK